MTVIFFSKNFDNLQSFPGRVENTVLWISEITQHLKNIVQIMIDVLSLLKIYSTA